MLLSSGRDLYDSEQPKPIGLMAFLMGQPAQPSTGFVYVTSDRSTAKSYALTRARYLKAKPGALIKGHRFPDLRKRIDAPVDPTAQPALLKITLPQSWYVQNWVDHLGKTDGTVFRQIPAQFITRAALTLREQV